MAQTPVAWRHRDLAHIANQAGTGNLLGMLGLFHRWTNRWAATAPDLQSLEDAGRKATTKQKARRSWQRMQAAARQAGDAPREATAAYELGLVLRALGKTRQAEAALSRAAALWDNLGNDQQSGDATLALAGACLMARRFDQADAHAQQAQARYARAGMLQARPQLGRLLHAIASARGMAKT